MKPLQGNLPSHARQQGVVLIVLAMILFMGGASWIIAVLNSNQTSLRRDAAITTAMNEAKERLIAYSVLHADYYPAAIAVGPGHLPCPDTNGNQAENTPCAGNALGRIPVSYTLPSTEVMPLSDFNTGIDQRFWYAVANEFKRSPNGVANTTSTGSLTLDGQTGIAALIIAPGEALLNQTRGNNTASNYLEAGNATGPNFVTSSALGPANFNDRVLPITVAELMSPVTARVVEAMRPQILAYQVLNGAFPANAAEFLLAVAGAPLWVLANNWPAVTTYTVLSPTTATIQFTSCNIVYTLDYLANTVTKSGARC